MEQNERLDSHGKLIRTEDCPIYLESQGKKWDPYIKVTKELCSRCPFFSKQCDGHTFKHGPDRPDREKIARLIWMNGTNDDAGWKTSWFYRHKEGTPYRIADQILALASDEEEIRGQERERIIKELERHISVNSVGQLVIAIGEDTHLATKDYKWWQVLKAAG